MSCMWFLEHCVRLEPDRQSSKEEPLADLEKILQKLAWRALKRDPPRNLTLSERLCSLEKVLQLEVDRSFISVSHADSLNILPRSKTGKKKETIDLPIPKEAPTGTTILFQSQYDNNTSSPQSYSFKTERHTRSMVEMSIQRGFTIGKSLELDVKIPTGVEDCGVSGKLGGQLQWSFNRGKVSRQEEAVTWAVDSHVEVAPNTTGIATLAVEECRWTADFTLECVIRPRLHQSSSDSPGDDSSDEEDEGNAAHNPPSVPKFPVFIRRKTNGDLLQVVNIPCSMVCNERPKLFKLLEGDPGGFTTTLEGACHMVCAVNQRMWLKEANLVTRSDKPAIMHQDSVIISGRD